jgi:hypothetical protein
MTRLEALISNLVATALVESGRSTLPNWKARKVRDLAQEIYHEGRQSLTVNELLTALRKQDAARLRPQLTRVWQTEVRHELLYVSQQAASMRTEVLRPDSTALGVVVELDELITKLTVLRRYIQPGPPPASASDETLQPVWGADGKVHFIYDARRPDSPDGYHNYWCACHVHFGADAEAAARHVATAPGGEL